VKAYEGGTKGSIRARCLISEEGEGVKEEEDTFLYMLWTLDTSKGLIYPSYKLVRTKSFTPSQAFNFKGLQSNKHSLWVHRPSPALGPHG